MEWRDVTVDHFKAGDPNTRVTGIVTTYMSNWDTIARAKAIGANMVITHEPTFYSHEEDPALYDNLDRDFYEKKRKFIADNGEKMPAEAKASAEAALKEAQEALKKADATAEDFEKAATALQTALMAAAQAVPPASGEQPQTDAGPAPEGKKKAKDGTVVDGDFEVVDDGKK